MNVQNVQTLNLGHLDLVLIGSSIAKRLRNLPRTKKTTAHTERKNRMYRYYCLLRPPSLGAIPKPENGYYRINVYDERKYVPIIDRYAWGWFECEKLSEQDIKDYELVEVEFGK